MKNENINITWVRAIACLLVVMIHWTQYIMGAPINSFQGRLSMYLYAFSFFGTNLFFMISGVFLFNPDTPFQPKQLFHNFLKIARPLFYFGTLFYIKDSFYHINTSYWDYFTLFKYPTWYLMHILPVYIMAPLIKFPKIEGLKNNTFAFLGIFALFFLTAGGKYPPFNGRFYDFHFGFIYMLTGYILNNISQDKRIKKLLWVMAALFGLLLILTAQLQIKGILIRGETSQGGVYFNNSGLFIYMQACLVFLFFQCLSVVNIRGGILTAVKIISKYSLGIFGWHMLIMGPLYGLIFTEIEIAAPLKYGVWYCSIIGCSLLISMADTWFWTRVRAWLAALWQKISTRSQKT